MKFDKEELIRKIREAEGLSNDDKSALLGLLNEKKTYGLVWEDSTEDAFEQLKTQLPILREVKDRQIVNDTESEHYPNHILIEGENLQTLVALTYTHGGMIDVIYIDPPYNTGHKDFTYNDSYVDSEDSFKHSKWLSFMDKRLRIAKELLSPRGMIFISIDDNEDAQLKLLCDEIFMNKNKVSDIIWQSRKSVSSDTFVSQNHNYTLVYAKNIDLWDKEEFRLPANTDDFENRDNDPRGPWVADPFDAPNLRPNLTYAIINPNTGEEYWPPKGRCWRTTEEQYKEFLADNRIVFGKKGTSKPQLKRFLDFAMAKGETPTSIWNDIETTTNGTQLLQSIFNGEKVFSNPKPVELIKRIMFLIGKNDLTILDFFAGSGTTMHATMQLNAEDGGHRQCILVTNNENGICENVTYERNKRVIEGYKTPKGNYVEGLKANNLRYYKVDFKERKQSHQSNRELAMNLKDALCIKEGIYREQNQFGALSLSGKEQMLRYFAETGRGMLMVYDTRVIPFITKEIEKMDIKDQPLKIYIFADGAYPYADDFASVIDKVSLIPMPYAYHRAIKDVLPDQDVTKVDDTELTSDEQKEMMAEAIEAENNEKNED